MSEDYAKWVQTNADKLSTSGQPPAPRAKPEAAPDPYKAWVDEGRNRAAERASAMIEHVSNTGYTPAQADTDLDLTESYAKSTGTQLDPSVLSNVRDELTDRIERQNRKARLMGSTKLAGWVSDSPVNAALAQRDLQNLSGLAATVDAAGKGTARLTRLAPADALASTTEMNLRALEDARRDGSQTFIQILEDETARNVGEGPLDVLRYYTGETGARNLINTVGRYAVSRVTGTVFSDEDFNAILEAQREITGEAGANTQRIADDIAQQYGTTASKAAMDERVAAISDMDGAWEQTAAFVKLIGEEPTAMGAWLGFTALESAPSMAVAAGVGLATRGAGFGAYSQTAAATTLGATSYATATSLNYQQLLAESGYDLRDPKQRMEFVNSPEVRLRLRDQAFTYGLVVGLMDAASGGVAGKTLAKTPAGDFALQAITQAVMGSGGEYLGLLASGQDINMVEIIVEGLAEMVTAPLEVIGVGGRKLGAARRIEQDRRFFNALAKSAEGSETKKKAPRKYRELLATLTKDGPVETLYVDAKTLNELFQSDPDGVSAEQFLSAVPGVDIETYRQALTNGGTVEIPTAAYATDVIGTRFDELIREHIKTDPSHMSAAEARQYRDQMKELIARAEETVDRAESGQTELERVAETARVELVSALRQAGRSQKVAEYEALQAVSQRRALASRLGMTMDEVLVRYPLADVQSSLSTMPGARPAQVTVELIERARAPVSEQDDTSVQTVRAAAEAEGLDLETASEIDVERAIERTYGPGASDVLLNQPELFQSPEDDGVRGSDLRGDGRKFTGFFSDVTRGTRQRPTRLDEYVPVIDLPQETKDFAEERKPYSGNFEDHIQTSIPGYREMQDAVAHTIAKRIGKGKMLDIGGSEGAIAKAIAARNPDAEVVVADPNTSMQETFMSKPQVPNARYELAAFGSEEDAGKTAWTEDDGTDIPFYDPKGEKFDYVMESMVFQFISNARAAQVARIKEMMSEDGVFLTFEKFGAYPDVFARNEAQKDAFKAQYYDQDVLEAKAKEVLRTGGDAIEGMTDLQVTVSDMEQILLDNFKVVIQIWDSGNFKGFAASDSYFHANGFAEALPSLDSEYATSATPRRVYEAAPQHNIPINDDGTITLTHWSLEARDVLRVDKAGTGPTPGDERRRAGPKKVYFGIGVGQPGGYVRDVNATVRHEVDVPLTDLYDFTTDPDKIKRDIPEDVVGEQRMGWVEQAIKDAGYKGYFVRGGPLGMAAVMYEDVAVDPTRVVDETAELRREQQRQQYGDTLYQSGAEPEFFSALTREVANAKQKQAGAKEWMAIIRKLPGVKKAEIDWSGVEAWLASEKGQIAREDVADFLRRNEVEIETVVRSGVARDDGFGEFGIAGYDVERTGETVVEEDDSYLRETGMEMFGDDIRAEKLREAQEDLIEEHREAFEAEFPDTDADYEFLVRDAAAALAEDMNMAETTPEEQFIADIVVLPDDFESSIEQAAYDAAYDSYMENPVYDYEFVVTFPDGETVVESVTGNDDEGYSWEGRYYRDIDDAREAIIEQYRDDAWDRAGGGTTGGGTKWGEYTEAGGENYREVLLTVPDLQNRGPNAKFSVSPFVNSTHFDEENIVVYTRLKERLAANGDKVLFVEEVQSDLGSYWRERGGYTPLDAETVAAVNREADTARQAATEARVRYQEARAKLDNLIEQRARAAGQLGGPGQIEFVSAVLRLSAFNNWRLGTRVTGQLNDPQKSFVEWLTEDFNDAAYDGVMGEFEDARAAEEEASAAETEAIVRERSALQAPREPVTPFEGEAYYALMMKKLLRMAAEEGADRLAWTPAYMQARRWSGAVQNVVKEIAWAPQVEGIGRPVGGRAVMVSLNGVNGRDTFLVNEDGVILEKIGYEGRIPEEQVVGKKLADLIGGTMAQRVLTEDAGTIEGENIVIGGDGYKIAYDQQIKKFVEKFAKKYGSKVTVDKTMPDFAKQTNADMQLRAVERTGYSNVMAALRDSGIRTSEFWTRYDAEVGELEAQRLEMYTSAIAENEAQLVEYQKEIDAISTPDENNLIDLAVADRLELLERKHRNLTAATERRRADMAEFSTDEGRDKSRYRHAVRKGYFSADEINSILPDGARPEGDAVWSVEITDKMRAAALEAQPLFQRRPDGARGSILLPSEPGRPATITLFDKADLSTFLHESGHDFLHVLQDVIRRGDAPEQLQEDWAAINNWWRQNAADVAKDGGVTEEQVISYLENGPSGDIDLDRKINTGLQEQWARAYEAYLMEGKAPSNALRAAFEAFSAWLLDVYRGARRLESNISPELREVFDRLLATDEEIAAAAARQGFDNLVASSAEALGITAEEYQHLVRLGGEAQDEARQKLLRDTMAPIRAQKTKEYREARAEVEAEIAPGVHAKPANRVREWLGNERWIGAPDDAPNPGGLPLDLRINRQSVIDDYGRETLDALPRGSRPLTTNETSLRADDVAGWFGYKSGDEMLQDVISTPRAEDEIRARVKAEMRKRFETDPVTDGTVPEAAVRALHGEKRGMLLAAELKALSKPGRKGQTTTRSQAAEIARRTIRQMPMQKAVRSGQYLAAERRAGERAALAVARGDMDEAYNAKREQLLNHQLYVESQKASDLLGKIERRVAKLKKKSVRENLAGEYLEAIDDILTSYDFRKSVTQRGARRREGLRNYIKMMEEAGRENELAIPSYVRDEAQRRPYRTLPVQQLEGVLDSLVNIEHTARMKQKLRDAQRERELTATVEGIIEEMDKNLKDVPANRVATPREKRKRGVRDFANLLLNADTLLRKIGGFNRGFAYDAIKEPIDDAAAWAAVARAEAADRFDELYSVYTAKEMNRMGVQKRHEALNGSFSKWDLISAALNMGNADNLSRLMDKDSGGGFTAQQVQYIKDQLDERDWQFVQSSWDFINSYWEQIATREKRLTGVVPKKVQASEVTTPYGILRGGYYPIKYRGDVNGMVAAEELQQIQVNTMTGRFGKAQTRDGHLEERAQGSGGRMLQLGMEVMHQHVGQVIHDLAFSEAVSNVSRIIKDTRVRTKFEQKGLLQDQQALELWLQDTATGQIAAGGVFGRLALRAKNGFTLSKLAFNLSTVAIQLTGITQSVATLGARNMAIGYSTYLSAPGRTSKEVVEFSPFMRERETTFNRDINDILGDMNMSGPAASRMAKGQQLIARYGFWLMQKVQFYGVDVPTWYAGYNDGLTRGFDEAKARKHADRMVARAQASGVYSDRSAFERGTLSADTRQNSFVRLFTTLGSYMFAKGNLAYEVYGRTSRDIQDQNKNSLFAAIKGATDFLLLFTVEAIAYNLIKGTLPDGDDEDDGWAEFLAKETALSMMSTVPGIRDLGGALSGFDAGAYGSILSTFARPAVQAAQGEADLPLLKATLNAVGVITGAPSGQLNRGIDAWYRLEQGEDVSPVEFIMGRR